jgi:hypothetical protein
MEKRDATSQARPMLYVLGALQLYRMVAKKVAIFNM